MTQLRTPWDVRATTGSGNNTYLLVLYRLALRVLFALETWPLLMRSNLTCVASMAWA